MSIRARLAKLERDSPIGDIPVWCDSKAELPATIKAMLADGEIIQDRTGQCVFWSEAGSRNGAHERALVELA